MEHMLTPPAYFIAAATLGLFGQLIRGLLGLLKTVREPQKSTLCWAAFFLSLPLGALSGLLGALVFDLNGQTPAEIPADIVWSDRNFTLMAISAGYFGADVIEGILRGRNPAA